MVAIVKLQMVEFGYPQNSIVHAAIIMTCV